MAIGTLSMRVTPGTYSRINAIKQEKNCSQWQAVDYLLAELENGQKNEDLILENKKLKQEIERLKRENESRAEEVALWQHKAIQKL